ncbi:unnamed protein product [Cylindrotheca closterium]|uniref:Uncharacterized protein n=1 Tax=Cylindrotheca closterium TaxID=2856 RepID=A0AAD2FIC2_9STRA|nr:unnamed protein product [Cylindrotheca closterium]
MLWPRTIRSTLLTKPKQCSRAYSWNFPKPPLPPSDEDVSQNGLPLFQKVIDHGNRPFVTEWPSRNLPGPLSYSDVAHKAATVANYIDIRNNFSSNASSPFVAHSTLPGSDYIACQWGCFGAAKASVPLSISQKIPELEHVLQDSDPAFIIVSELAPNCSSVLQAAINLRMVDRVVYVDDIISSAAAFTKPKDLLEDRGARMDTPALLLYTSGTTGKPKGVLHTQSNLYHQITDLVAAWEWKPSDAALHVLPLHHVHGVVNILSCAAYAGAQVQFQPFDANQLWHQWADTNSGATLPTTFMAVPTIYAKLLEAAKDLPPSIVQKAVDQTLYPMRLQVSGSAALPVSILEQWQNLTGHTLLERYGMTEFAMALSNPYQEDTISDANTPQQRHPGHVGLPLPSVGVRLVDQDDGSILDPIDGTPGALQVKGPTVFQEYWNRPDATAEAFSEDGYFDTGDVAEYNASIDSYRILGRASVDILKIGGHKLSALEVERVLLENEEVLEAVVIGVPDDVWGQKVGMIGRQSSSSDLSLEDIQDWCASRLEKHKTPTSLIWLDAIPKNAMGKVNKKELVDLFEGK